MRIYDEMPSPGMDVVDRRWTMKNFFSVYRKWFRWKLASVKFAYTHPKISERMGRPGVDQGRLRTP